ncbi:hypothetical protein T484DRAFT_1919099 [Baffinella frigidus]|nr:hypothetical protein T484DRAFT_1919099 [Cryptophyta sp. CCMP2293]
MRRRAEVWCAGAMLLLVILSGAPGRASGSHDNKIIIGTSQSLSGTGLDTEDVLLGYRFWAEHTNLQGGILINGTRYLVEIKFLDDHDNATLQKLNYLALVESGEADVLFGGSVKSLEPMYDAAAPHKMLNMACCSGPEAGYIGRPFLFGTPINSALYPVGYIEATYAQGARTIALLWHTGSSMTVVFETSYDFKKIDQSGYDAMVPSVL